MCACLCVRCVQTNYAELFRNIRTQERFVTAYYRVAFFGQGFPESIKNREFIYRGAGRTARGEAAIALSPVPHTRVRCAVRSGANEHLPSAPAQQVPQRRVPTKQVCLCSAPPDTSHSLTLCRANILEYTDVDGFFIQMSKVRRMSAHHEHQSNQGCRCRSTPLKETCPRVRRRAEIFRTSWPSTIRCVQRLSSPLARALTVSVLSSPSPLDELCAQVQDLTSAQKGGCEEEQGERVCGQLSHSARPCRLM